MVKLNKEGQKHGEYKAYFENKEIRVNGKYENGMMMGTWTYYYDNKNIRGIYNFLNGDGSDVSKVSGIPKNGNWV